VPIGPGVYLVQWSALTQAAGWFFPRFCVVFPFPGWFPGPSSFFDPAFLGGLIMFFFFLGPIPTLSPLVMVTSSVAWSFYFALSLFDRPQVFG